MRRSLVIAVLAAATVSACGQKQPEVIIDPAPPSNNGGDAGGALAAGGPGAAGGAGGATGGAAARTPPTAEEVKAAASDPNRPHRKAGLWQLTASNGEDSATSTLCVDDTSEARVNAFETRRLLPFGGRPGGGGPGGGGARAGGPGGGEGGARPGGEGGGGRPGGFQGGGGGGTPCPPPKISKAGAGWSSTSTCKREFGDASMTIVTKDSLSGDLQTKYSLKATRTVSGAPRPEMNRTTVTTVNGVYKGACPSGQKGGDLTSNGATTNLMTAGGGRGSGGG